MKQQTKAFIVSIEITISGYVYYHSWIINTFNHCYAEILLEQHVENLYKDQEYEYSISGVYAVDKKDIATIKQFIPAI
ncbi:hypothetical protein IPM65_02475 [Candidatus Roizmanbacteria bacterium]|nr:MAG: hypothetical protein IPM65_02475 [Candidatus Roizmanbacteria bacterium]